MKITIDIDESIITIAARQEISRQFAAPGYRGDTPAEGYKTIRAQVEEYAATVDVREKLREIGPGILQAVMRESLREEFTRMVKGALTEMVTGTKLDKQNALMKLRKQMEEKGD